MMDGGLGYFPPEECEVVEAMNSVVCSAKASLHTIRVRMAQPSSLFGLPMTVSSPFGAAKSNNYMYDFRRGHQAGGLRHFTLVNGLSHLMSFDTHPLDVDTESW